MIRYMLTKTKLKNSEKGYIVYGIAQVSDNYIRIIARDISTDNAFIRNIINKCNLYCASPKHIMDIIYDSLV